MLRRSTLIWGPICCLLLFGIFYSTRNPVSISNEQELDQFMTEISFEQEIKLKKSRGLQEILGYTYFTEATTPLVTLEPKSGTRFDKENQDVFSSSPSTQEPYKKFNRFSSKLHSLQNLAKAYINPLDHSDESDSFSANQIHPVSVLIEEAAEKWQKLLNSQSRTLAEAVVEYQSRYGRNPPKGFNLWWKFATENNVILVDEYDQINIDIEPFLALPSKEMLSRARFLAANPSPNQFNLNVKGGKVLTTGPQRETYRAHDAANLLSLFSKYIEDMPITLSSDDGPALVITGHARETYLELARSGKELQGNEVNKTYDDEASSPWVKACASDSVAKAQACGRRTFTPSSNTASFIGHDHLSAMNICNHPENLPINGLLNAWSGPGPAPLWPIFSWSKTQLHSDILLAPMDQFYTPTEEYWEWEHKQSKLLWRGGNTGIFAYQHNLWKSTQRPRLVTIANEQIGSISVRFASTMNGAKDVLKRFVGKLSDINAFYFDIAYANRPLQCDAVSCEEYVKNYRFAPVMSVKEQNGYKYILDVDGNAWSGRFHRLMASKSVVFKSTIFPEWYSSRIMPWYHYVPIKNDYSDLHDVSAYFMGTPDGNNDHDDAGKLIGSQGQDWTAKHWREVDMAAYQFRLYLEYGRALYKNKGSHDFVLDEH